jgi:hypothetical protein
MPIPEDSSLSDDRRVPEIDFRQFLRLERKSRSEVERQVTVARYRVRVSFDFARIEQALNACKLRASDEVGMLDIRTSRNHDTTGQETMPMESQKDEGDQDWIRSLFGVIGEKRFRWFDFDTRSIYEGLISGTLQETFMVEFYKNIKNELNFLTYGGVRYGSRIIQKLQDCFRSGLVAERDYFDYPYLRSTIARDDFRLTLKRIDYSPEGQDDYGTVDQASMRTRYSNIIDPDAQRIKEILENERILIQEFGARSSLYVDEVRQVVAFRFEMSRNGLVTIFLPEIEFPRPMQDIEFENEYYKVVRRIYSFITGTVPIRPAAYNSNDILADQLVMEFLRDSR